MQYTYDNHKINYEEYINNINYDNLIILHGWGQDRNQFLFLKENFTNINIYLIDLPNFGLSDKLKKYVNLDFYVNSIIEFINLKNLKNIILLGHSFGGRIIIKLLSINNLLNIKKIILIDSAGIKPKRNIKYYFKIYTYKILKKFNKNINLGSKDYKNADTYLKGTMSNIINEDLKKYLSLIKINTLIIWGSDDDVTNINNAYIMNKKIKNSKLYIIPNGNHFSYKANMNYFIEIIRGFIND